MRIAEIVYPLPLHRSFDYQIPPSCAQQLAPGARVRAPFGTQRERTGMVLSVREGEPAQELKSISQVLDPEPLLSKQHLDLARWLSRHYYAPIGECLKLMLPTPLWNSRKAIVLDEPRAISSAPAVPRPHAAFELTQAQIAALETLKEKLHKRLFSVSLLYGVPASGKTEVYLRLIQEAVAGGGQALFLVPEISLTRPFFQEFSSAAGFPVALWHSQLSQGHRRSVWLALAAGAVPVVVGARSAGLLPFKDLRLVVIDEEQDESYKQEGQPPFYHARDVVLERARSCGAAVILGSATPSLEAFTRAQSGEWELLRMEQRVSGLMPPPVTILDRSAAPGRCISEQLLTRIQQCLSEREQVILLVNRRGFSNLVLCRKCGWVCRCPSCALAFIHHRQSSTSQGLFFLRCHHCGRQAEVPSTCASCAHSPLQFVGAGTQKVVSELKTLLPGARILRMDRDTVSKEKSSEAGMYQIFKDGGADILVGTKLVAKGFHFPRVTLVGVVDADTMLQMPDFRAAERTVQMLVQAAGRAGRSERPGEVYLQTSQSRHYAIQAVLRRDYTHFARQELAFRQELDYPPSSILIRLIFLGGKEETVKKAAQSALEHLRRALPDTAQVLGPAPGIHPRLHGRFRYHLLLKLKEPTLSEAALQTIRGLQLPSSVRMQVNVDPYDFF